MAQNKTLLALRTEIRNRGDFQTPYFSDSELTGYVNDSYAALYDYLAEGDPERFSSEDSISVVSGTATYALPADFMHLNGVEIIDSTLGTGRRRVERYQYKERNLLGRSSNKESVQYRLDGTNIRLEPTPTYSTTLYLDYVAAPTILASDGDTVDSVNSWTEWVILDCLIKCANKEGSEAQQWERRQQAIHKRILTGGIRDQGEVKTIVDTRSLGKRGTREGGGWR